MSAYLTELQEQASALLSAHAFFTPEAGTAIPVLTEKLKDIESEIELKVSSIGACVLIVTPSASIQYRNSPGPELSSVTLVARVIELPTINASGSGQPAAYIAQIVAQLLHLWRPSIDGADNAPLVCTGIDLANDPRALSYDVTFETSIRLNPDPATFIRI